MDAHHTNAELRQKFLKDFYNEKTVKKLGFQLMKNTDVTSLLPKQHHDRYMSYREVKNS